jgi:TolB-like protein/Tfp pilus assembly protein PilF
MFWQTRLSYEFGPFRLDAQERRLLRHEEVVPLTPKVFDTLLVLVQNSGHILSKDEVLRLVWRDTLVEEGSVSRNVSTLRKALGEDSRACQYIETIPWRGYRFVADVKEVRVPSVSPVIVSLAVLPFVNVNGDSTAEYLSDGITDSLINNLARLTKLRVTSRNSAFRYRGLDIDAQSVGRELDVNALLIGRVAISDDLLSISVELIDAREDSHIWGAQYIRKPEDLFAVQETIARAITATLQLELTGQESQQLSGSRTQDPEAYVSFLKGRYHFNKLTFEGVTKGIEYFSQAIERDPAYALAYAGLGDCHNYLAARDQAKKAVLKALELDENLGEAHASLGFFRFLYDWDFAGAEREFERALTLSPNYAEAHHWYAIYLANIGRHQEADQEARLAVALDPLSLLMNMTPALNFYLAHQYGRAREQLQKVLDMEPNFAAARSVLGSVLLQQGMYKEAMAEYQKVLEMTKGVATVEPSVKAIIAHGYARWGKRRDALSLLEQVTAAGTVSPYSIAGIHAALGETDSAFEWLEKAYSLHDLQLVSLIVDPTLEGVRSDPRFGELVRRVGLSII